MCLVFPDIKLVKRQTKLVAGGVIPKLFCVSSLINRLKEGIHQSLELLPSSTTLLLPSSTTVLLPSTTTVLLPSSTTVLLPSVVPQCYCPVLP